MLHVLSSSPYYMDVGSFFSFLEEDEDLLLLQDGVLLGHKSYSNKKENFYLEKLKIKNINVYALKEDVDARGLISYFSSYIFQISYTDFVKLTVKNSQCFFW